MSLSEPETRFEEKQKERITKKWDSCVAYFTDWLNQQDLINSFGDMALKSGEVKEEKNIKSFLESHFREETRSNFENYSSFCSYAFLVWTLVKVELKHIPPKEKKDFTKKVRDLRTLSGDYEEILKVFDQLNNYVAQYMPMRQDSLDRELRL